MAQSADDFLGAPSADGFLDRQEQATTPSPWLKWPAVIGGAAVTGLDLGLGAVGDIDELGNKYLPSWMTKNLLTGKPMEHTIVPTSNQLLGATNDLGLTGQPLEHPDIMTQRLVAGTVSGIGAAAPLAFGDPLGVMAVGGAAGAASAETNELLPNSPLVSTLVGTGAGLVSGSVLGDVRNLLALRAAKQSQAAAESAHEAAQDATFEGKQKIAADSAAAVRDAKARTEAARAALTPHDPPYEQLATQFAPTQTLQEAGENLQTAGRKWLTTEMPKRQAAAWAPVDKLVPQGTEIELPEYAGALTSITSKGSRLGADLKSPIFDNLNRQLQGALRPSEDIPGEEATMKPLTWQDARELRSLIGDAMGDTATVKPIHQQDLANLYRALTHDMGARASEVSPQAAKAFNDANATSMKLFDFAEGPLAKVVSGKKADLASDPNPEAVARRLITAGRSGATDLAALRMEFPEAVNGLTAAMLRQNGKQWSGLAPEAKLALAPGNAGNIDAAIAKHAQDMAAFNLAHKTLAAGLTDARAAAASGASSAKVQLQSAQRQAKRDLDNANAAYEAAKSQHGPGVTKNLMGGILGGVVGPEVATLGLHALGLPGSDLVHGAWGGVIGAMAPWLLRSSAKTIMHPRLPLAAVQGARGGTAATALRGSQQ